GFFNLSTWITAIVGAAVLLLAFHLFSGQSSGRRSSRWAGRR
ncbi:MAG: putative rane protein YeaQ/YmgE, transglycosylase-associated protein family, partial [Actinomycetia bacterium]|nr:putative rane protein YeaQ/YmgE, transglycosylase-associated protein family [Actinomycetes bacterium]